MKVRLLRPLDGLEMGDTADYPEADARRLARRGAVTLLEAKSEPAPANKARKAAPSNKAAAFDHDGDGNPGGAPKGGNRKKGGK
jgi:hypothetical protein